MNACGNQAEHKTKKTSLKDIAYAYIKNKIIECEYLPNSFLDESTISKTLGVSRTPIREALNRLEQENLVRIYSKRGVLVTDVSIGEVNEIFSVRELLETNIILTYPQQAYHEQFLEIEKQLLREADDENLQYRIDADIHSLIIKSSKNRYFIALMENIYDQNHRLRIIAGQKIQQRLQKTTKEHLQIVRFLLENDLENAAKAMRVHLQNSRMAAIEGLTTK